MTSRAGLREPGSASGRFWALGVLGLSMVFASLGCEVGSPVVYQTIREVPPGDPFCDKRRCSTVPLEPLILPAFIGFQQVCPPEGCPIEDLPEGLGPGSELRGHVRLRADTPSERKLSGVRASQLVLELSGPVSLTFEHSELIDVVVIFAPSAPPVPEPAVPTSQALPELRLESSVVVNLSTQREGDAYSPGRVSAQRSTLSALDVSVMALTLHSSPLVDSRIAAEELSIADAQLTQVELSAAHGVLVGVDGTHVQTARCGELALLRVGIAGERSGIGPCELPLRLHRGSVVNARLDGDLHSEDASFVSVQFGTRAPTRFDGWAGDIQTSRFCPQTELLRLHESMAVTCSSCELPERFDACAFDGQPTLSSNSCELLRNEEQLLASCTMPWPEVEFP
jgi:hypothetical protein